MVIAIDGPAGTGKSTVAHRVAEDLGIVYLNSGSFYRALTLALLDAGVNIDDSEAVVAFAKKQKLDYVNARLILNGKDVDDLLHQDKVDANVSKVSAVVELRHMVNERMRQIVKSLSIICEGRDMTTVVFPDAEYKFYLDASIDVQAQRRFDQGVSSLTLEEIKNAIIERDKMDRNKAEGSLKQAPDAVYVDTSNLTIDEVCAIIENKIKHKGFAMEQKEVVQNVGNGSDDIHTQLEASINKMEPVENGSNVQGTVVQVTDDLVFVDVNCKSEGKIPVSEFAGELPSVGDVITVYLVNQFGKYGPEVSKIKADERRLWDEFKVAFEKKEPVDGTISSVTKGGYMVNLGGGISAFLPISQADSQKVEKEEKLVGLKGKFYVERLYSNGKRNVVVNRRKYLEEQMNVNREKFFNEVKIGDTVKGVVKSFTSFGAFIDLGGFDGLLHINDMSWGHVTRPKDFVKKGQEIELKVIRLDQEGKRINLSLKHFTEDPWMHFEEKYHVNDIVKGKVTKLTDFGAFIELEEGIEGLAHISEFSWTKKINKPSDMVKEGDEVECMVLGYDIQAGRVSIGLKQVTANPWDTISEKYPVGTKVNGKVVKITNSGAFVQLEEGIDAFLAGEDLSWTKKVKHPGSEIKVDQQLDVVVIECDPENHRIRVGVKQLTDNPWIAFAEENKVGSTLEGEVTSITEFGIFVKAPCGIEGLVNKVNLCEDRETPYEEAVKKYNVGDKVNVYVVSVDVEREKVGFSVREYKKAQARAEISQYMSSNNDDDGAYTIGDSLKDQSEDK
ncbi:MULTISPECIES: 30S ribosomal protein S1 [Treponema]|jgi:small subunit ribosomal protein S1|uniref:Cytidylate kinase n=1 Tax=Treponema rectale TaxID=744512 RepID=A0A840SF71_9SPIR|nr:MULTISPECIES: 30S ribosomal protein S1 [Treponema]MBB5218091.1 small subunit ribosomal protein S1 [Treponema rectale]MBE6354585.1 30S ribosomal protein S1 [Treponema sp.]MBO6176600.1 30S ribosomal protein S1 [Treponema sp.]QOS40197.1 30S ribosomal protein S1 [Treponema rectale]